MSPQQLSIFVEPRARHNDPETSHQAAAKVRPSTAGRIKRIAELVDNAGPRGCTRDEVYQLLILDEPNLAKETSSSAVSQCKKAGLIAPAGPKRKRMSLRNEPQEIYVTPRWLNG